VREALRAGLKVEIEAVWTQMQRQEAEERPLEFLALLKEGMGIERDATGFHDDLTMYLAQHGYALRRSDLAARVMMSA
jgi:hypothetical protein